MKEMKWNHKKYSVYTKKEKRKQRIMGHIQTNDKMADLNLTLSKMKLNVKWSKYFS